MYDEAYDVTLSGIFNDVKNFDIEAIELEVSEEDAYGMRGIDLSSLGRQFAFLSETSNY